MKQLHAAAPAVNTEVSDAFEPPSLIVLLDLLQRFESCEKLSLVGARKRGNKRREAPASHSRVGTRSVLGEKSELADRSVSSYLDTGCTSTADIP